VVVELVKGSARGCHAMRGLPSGCRLGSAHTPAIARLRSGCLPASNLHSMPSKGLVADLKGPSDVLENVSSRFYNWKGKLHRVPGASGICGLQRWPLK
jgi:hypothetical protein